METNWTSYEDYLTKVKKKYIEGLETAFFAYLSKPDAPRKIPFIEVFQDLSDIIPVTYETTSIKDFHFPNDTEFKVNLIRQVKSPTWDVLRYTSMKIYSKTKEKTIQTYQRGMPIKTAGRMRGNMEYLEDR
jgi:HSP90 family molecular chaperone